MADKDASRLAAEAAKKTILKKYEAEYLAELGNERVARGLTRERGNDPRVILQKRVAKAEQTAAELRKQLEEMENSG